MPKYQCPECEAVLRRAEAIPEGKKIRCPKCESTFRAKAMPDDEPAEEEQTGYAVAGMPPPKKKEIVVEEENSDPYKVIKETGDEVKQEIYLGSLRDKFAKSKIGPAMYKTVIPSNWLLRLGLFSCVCSVFMFAIGLWPIVFCEADPIRPFIRPRVDIMLQALLSFSFGAIMCLGASKMHDLTNYPLAIIGSIMALLIYVPSGIMIALVIILILGPLGMLLAAAVLGLSFVGVWCLIILLSPSVREGFRERSEEMATGVP
jgi:hypothetical protein